MMDPYFLRTPRLGFRPWQADDSGLAWGLWGDERVTALLGPPFSPEQIEARHRLEMANLAQHGFQYWPFFLLASGEHVGCCGFKPYRPEEKIAEMGFHLRPEHWRRGYGEEAARGVIEYAFQQLDVSALYAGHHPNNVPSGKLLLKLGFVPGEAEYFERTGLLHPAYRLSNSRKPA